ncbi:MAG: hypothetical protein ACI8ZO_001687 [Flavobacteriales bacterium]|jgi:hypothetical protein
MEPKKNKKQQSPLVSEVSTGTLEPVKMDDHFGNIKDTLLIGTSRVAVNFGVGYLSTRTPADYEPWKKDLKPN